jgi:gamma-glutamylcyclotransferase (GGCT)/AIG2-like uncharacterized protein YtfP
VDIFVYSTLKVGGKLSEPFKEILIKSKKAEVKGCMYDLGGFPGARFDQEGVIKGEIHSYKENPLPEMDSIEGYRGRNSRNNLYDRIKIKVGEVECWTYQFSNWGRLWQNKIIEEWPV